MSDSSEPQQGMYFYAQPDFGRPEKFYPVESVVSCTNLPFPAMSYKNISRLAVEGYMEPDCSGSNLPLNDEGDLEPPVLSFGSAS
jgi:hypothetical protein